MIAQMQILQMQERADLLSIVEELQDALFGVHENSHEMIVLPRQMRNRLLCKKGINKKKETIHGTNQPRHRLP